MALIYSHILDVCVFFFCSSSNKFFVNQHNVNRQYISRFKTTNEVSEGAIEREIVFGDERDHRWSLGSNKPCPRKEKTKKWKKVRTIS